VRRPNADVHTHRPASIAGRGNHRLYLSGLDSETIGFRANCSPTTVIDIVRRAGHPIRPRGNRPGPRRSMEDGEMIKRYRLGETGQQIADAAGCSVGTVYRILQREGVDRRPSNASLQRKLEARRARLKREREGG
jgi:hypothetical protein